MGYIFFIFCWVLSGYAHEDFERLQIEERIKPIGKVKVEHPANNSNLKLKQNSLKESSGTGDKLPLKSGEAIYKQYCITCHQSGLANAPKFRSEEWKVRLAKKKLEGLLDSAIQGINAMPAKGTCYDCTQEEINMAIKYMLPHE